MTRACLFLAAFLVAAPALAQAPGEPSAKTTLSRPDGPAEVSSRLRHKSPSRYADAVATSVFAGEVVVVEVKGRRGTMGAGTEAIYSDVTFQPGATAVLEPGLLAGLLVDGQLQLSFLGGEVDGKGMTTSHGVSMQVGDTLMLVVTDPASGNPTYRGRPGVLRVVDGHVFSYNGRPVIEIRPAGPFSVMNCESVPAPVAPTPKGTASGRVLSAECANPSDAMTPAQVLEAWRGFAAEPAP